jgi:hypothetical protein
VDELFDGMASDAVNTKLRVLNHHTNKWQESLSVCLSVCLL